MVTICGAIAEERRDGRYLQSFPKAKKPRTLVIPSLTARTWGGGTARAKTGKGLVFPNHPSGGVMAPDAFRKTVATLQDSEIDSVAASKQFHVRGRRPPPSPAQTRRTHPACGAFRDSQTVQRHSAA